MPTRYVPFAVLLPLLALLGGVVRSEARLASGQTWFFETRGYDPRDLLRGHYLRYRVVYSDTEGTPGCAAEDPDCCLCLTRTDARRPPRVTHRTCEVAEQQCDGYVHTGRLEQLERYYIPEEGRQALEARLRSAHADSEALIELSITDGEPAVKALWLHGEPISR